MNKNIYFVSSNKRKVDSYRKRLAEIGWNLVNINKTVPECRDFDCENVALDKMKTVREIVQDRPVFVEDRGLEIEELNKFPGSHIKILTEMIGLEKFGEILGSRKVHARFVYAIVFLDVGNNLKSFVGDEKGFMCYNESKSVFDLRDIFFYEMFPSKPLSLLDEVQNSEYEQTWTKKDAMAGLIGFLRDR